MSYSPLTDSDIKSMLKKLDLSSIEELFNIVPDKFKIDYKKFNIDKNLSEQDVLNKLTAIGKQNISSSNTSFLGGGAYDHYVPKIVDFLSSRSEFYTAYTPYQPEVSQGTLQYLYEFQTMICELSGMDISNASLYDGASAVAEACSMAVSVNNKSKILLSNSLNPNYKDVVETYFSCNGIDVDYIDTKAGVTDISTMKDKITDDVACVVVQSPNYFGLIEDWKKIVQNKKNEDVLVVAVSDPMSLSILKSPGELGCDVYVGEGQSLGNYLIYGGPYIGLFSTLSKYARKIPGRIIGRTEDLDGKEGFVMTLQTREQHIRRERATSNICTNQGLIALRATIYMSLLGKEGLPSIAHICYENAQYAAEQIVELKSFDLLYDNRNFIKEFVVKTSHSVSQLIDDASKEGFNLGGVANDSDDSLLLIACTEQRSKDDIDKLVNFLKSYKQ